MKARTARIPLRFSSILTLEDLVETLATLGYEEIVEVIVALDARCEDWGVTERLHKHFAKEMKKLPEEDKL